MSGNKITGKIESVSKKSTKEWRNNETELDVEKVTSEKKISPEERQQSIDEL